MTPLRIQCETCQSWLRVRDPGFLGEVHACPKCGSMVLISAGAAASDTAAAEAVPAADLQPVAAEPIQSVEPEAVPASIEDPLSAEPQAVPQAPAPPHTATHIATIASGVSLAIACAVFAFAWVSQSDSDSGDQEIVSATAPAPTAASIPEPTPEPTDEAPNPAALHEKALEESVDEPIPAAEGLVAVEQPPALETTPIDPLSEQRAQTTALPDAAVPSTLEASPEVQASHEEPAMKVAIAAPKATTLPDSLDPLEHDPESLGLVLIRGEALNAVDEPPVADGTQSPVATPAEESLDAQLALAARHGGIAVRRGPSNAPHQGAPKGDAAARLAVTLPLIELTDAPLFEAVELLAELSDAPVSLGPDALLLTGVELRKPVSLNMTDATIGAALQKTLAQARLAYRVEGAQVVADLQEADQSRTVRHRLQDLCGDDPAAFAALLDQIGPRGIDYRLLVGEGGELPTTATRRTQYELLVLCERLRVARGLPQQSKYPLRLIEVEPSGQRLAPKLARRTTFSFVTPTPLEDVLAHWRQASGMTLLVDWRSLSDADLGPRSTVLCSATNRSWRDALDGVLHPLGLAWAPAGAGTLLIGSQESVDARETVEFYPIDRGAGEGFGQSIATEHPMAGVVCDRASGALLVRGGGSTQRNTYEAWLDQVQP